MPYIMLPNETVAMSFTDLQKVGFLCTIICQRTDWCI